MQEYQEWQNDFRTMDRPISLAMAYVKWQQFDKIYEDLEKGYKAGTIFPELNLPFTGRGCEK